MSCGHAPYTCRNEGQRSAGRKTRIDTDGHTWPTDYNLAAANVTRAVTDKLQWVLNAAAHVITGTWKFDRGLGQILHDQLHWLDIPDRVLFKLAVTVHSVWTAAYHRICQSTTSRSPVLTGAFRQPSPTCRTAFPAQHLRPSLVLSCWPSGLELTAGFYPGSSEQHRLF